MYKSLLLFGSTGHLANTKIIPAARKLNMLTIGASRKYNDQTIPWISINSANFPRCDVTYFSLPPIIMKDYIDKVPDDTVLCLEKPHGSNKETFEALVSDLSDKNVLFVDHFLHKYIPNLTEYNIDYKDINYINVTFYEKDSVEHRLSTFDQMGIVRDIIQNHLLFVLSTMIGVSTNQSRLDVLNSIENISKEDTIFHTYDYYGGSEDTPTFANCTTKIDHIEVNILAGKKQHNNEYSITLHENNKVHIFNIQPRFLYECYEEGVILNCESLPKHEAYESVLDDASNRIHDKFPTPEEISRSWEIVEEII